MLEKECCGNYHTLPLPNECIECLLGKILTTSSTLELQLILGLDQKLSDKIVERRGITLDFNSLDEIINVEQIKTIKEAIGELNVTQLKYLNKPSTHRNNINSNLENLNLDDLDSNMA